MTHTARLHLRPKWYQWGFMLTMNCMTVGFHIVQVTVAVVPTLRRAHPPTLNTITSPDYHNRKLQLVARCDGRGGPPTHLFGRCGEKGGDLGGPCDPQARAASPTSAPPSGRRGPDLTQSTLPPSPLFFTAHRWWWMVMSYHCPRKILTPA